VVKSIMKSPRTTVFFLASLALFAGAAAAQSINDIVAPAEPLILKQQGSFFVGGRQTQSDATGWDQTPPVSDFGSGDVTVDQMYVQFQTPITSGSRSKVPLANALRIRSKASVAMIPVLVAVGRSSRSAALLRCGLD
jgi:hypothetical protein